MGDFTRVKSPMKIHGRFYLRKKTSDYKMTHQLFTLFWIISNILTFHFYTFSVICTFYFYIAFKGLKIHQKYLIKKVPYFPFLEKFIWDNLNSYKKSPWGNCFKQIVNNSTFQALQARCGEWRVTWLSSYLQVARDTRLLLSNSRRRSEKLESPSRKEFLK